MFKLLLLISFLLMTSCSGKKAVSPTTFKVSLGALLSDSQFEGGLLIRAVNLDKGISTDHKLVNNRTLEFDNGRWQFFVVGFQTLDLATALCASSLPISLEGSSVTVSLNLSQATCLNAPFDTLAEDIKFEYFIKAPSAPVGLDAIFSGASIDITWDEPLSNGGDPIVSYIIQQSIGGSDWLTLTATADSFYNDTSFTFGQLHRYRVAAVNIKGPGNFSNIVEQFVSEPPSQAVFSNPFNSVITAGECEMATLQTLDSSFNPSVVLADTIFTPNIPSGVSFYADENCTSAQVNYTLSEGQDQLLIYMIATQTGTSSLEISSVFGSLIDTVQVTHSLPVNLVITSSLAGMYLQGEPIFIEAEVYDGYGNLATSFSELASFTFSSDPTGSANITNLTTPIFTGGVLDTQIQIDNPGLNYQLTLNAPGLAPSQTGYFDINIKCDSLQNPFGNSDIAQGTAENPYTICDTTHIISLGDAMYADAHVVMRDSVDFNGIDFNGTGPVIPYFEGVFDGGGFSIDNISIQDNIFTGDFGFFGSLLASSVVKDLTFTNVTIFASSAMSTGALAGVAQSSSLISNVQVLGGSVTGHTTTGGLVGNVYGHIEKSKTNVSVETTSGSSAYAGGFVAGVESSGTITECASYGNVNSEDANAIGGFAAAISGSISNSYALGDVTGVNVLMAGGFVGQMGGIGTPNIENSYSFGTVENTASKAGAFIGQRVAGTVTASFANMDTAGIAALVGDAGVTTGITGLITTDFSTQADFQTAGWDFPTVWSIVGGRPVLSWE